MTFPLQLNYPLTKRKDKSFILSRLRLLNEQFCLRMDQYLYQSYFDAAGGSHDRVWPVSSGNII